MNASYVELLGNVNTLLGWLRPSPCAVPPKLHPRKVSCSIPLIVGPCRTCRALAFVSISILGPWLDVGRLPQANVNVVWRLGLRR